MALTSGITTGVLAGANDPASNPDGTVTAEQAAELLMAGADGTEVSVPFTRQVNGGAVVNSLPANLATNPLG